MANTVNSPNMLLPVPVVGVDPGPQWASDVNACLSLIDTHDHSANHGVQITPSGININTDLPLNNSNITLARAIRYTSQPAVLTPAADIDCTYVVLGDLYYNDGAGNKVRITQSGGVAGSPGSISNLTSPASASYVSSNETFVWQSAANTPANLDAASVILRDLTANSFGLTLAPPTGMAADYVLNLPSLPTVQSFLTLDASGNIAPAWTVDNVTTAISSNTVIVKDGGITKPKLAALGQQISSSCGVASTSSTSYVNINNLTVTITTSGRPVTILCVSDGTTGNFEATSNTGSAGILLNLQSNGTSIAAVLLRSISALSSPTYVQSYPPSSLFHFDVTAGAGTYTYNLQMKVNGSGDVVSANFLKLVAYEN